MGDGSEVLAYGVGTVYLCPDVLLQEVLYVPDFTVNLCSVSKLAKSGFAISFEATECTIAKDGQEVVRGTGVAGLYML